MKFVFKNAVLGGLMLVLASCGTTNGSSAAPSAKTSADQQPATSEAEVPSVSSEAEKVAAKLVGTYMEHESNYILEYEGSSFSFEQRHALDVYDDGSYMFVYYNQQIVTDSDTNYGNFLFATFGSYTKASADPDDDECTEFVYSLSLPERMVFVDNYNWGSGTKVDSADGEKSVSDIIAAQTALFYNLSFLNFAADIYVKVDASLGMVTECANLETATASTLTTGGAFAVKDVFMNPKAEVAYDYDGTSYTYDSRYLLKTFADDSYMFTYITQQIVTDSWTDYGSLIRTTFGTFTKTSADPDDEECTDYIYTLGEPTRVIFSDAWNWGSGTTIDTDDGEKTVAEVNELNAGLYYNFLYWPTTDVVYVTADEAVGAISSAYGASLIQSAE